MSDEILAVQLLFDECSKENPDMTKINEYVIRCCNNNEDINTRYQYDEGGFCHKWTPLHMACTKSHYEIINKLLDPTNNFKYPIDINSSSRRDHKTPLIFACGSDYFYSPLSVRRLLQHPNIDVNKAGEYKFTPLHIACFNRRIDAMIELLKHPNIQVTAKETMYGRLPLHIACNEDNIDIVQMLLSHQQEQFKSEQLIATNYYKESPLHIACSCNRSGAVVKLLLENSDILDINASDKSGDTPLHAACSKLYI